MAAPPPPVDVVVPTVADAVAGVATGVTVTVSTTTAATTRERSMKTSVADARRRDASVLAREKKKEPYWDGP